MGIKLNKILGVNTVIVVTKDDLKNTGHQDPIKRVYNKKFSYPNVSLVIVERKRQTMLFKLIDLNSPAVATNCDKQKVVRMRNKDK